MPIWRLTSSKTRTRSASRRWSASTRFYSMRWRRRQPTRHARWPRWKAAPTRPRAGVVAADAGRACRSIWSPAISATSSPRRWRRCPRPLAWAGRLRLGPAPCAHRCPPAGTVPPLAEVAQVAREWENDRREAPQAGTRSCASDYDVVIAAAGDVKRRPSDRRAGCAAGRCWCSRVPCRQRPTSSSRPICKSPSVMPRPMTCFGNCRRSTNRRC